MTTEPIPDPGYQIVSVNTTTDTNGTIITQIVEEPIIDSEMKETPKIG